MSGHSTGSNNQLLSDGAFDYEFDAEGNRVSRERISTAPAEDHRVEYEWDHRNRLTGLTFKDETGAITKRVTYVYDLFDRRIAKLTDADADDVFESAQTWVYDDDHIALAFLDSDGEGAEPSSLTNRYLHGPQVDQILANEQFVNGLDIGDTTANAGEVLFPLTDHLGTVRDLAIWDAVLSATTIANHIVYDSFGRIVSQTDPPLTPHFAFTGREWDADAQLYYYRARWYDAVIGRFVSEDPIGFTAGDTNINRYVGNDPGNFVDPSGLVGEGWEWNWHHMLDQAVFTPEFKARHRLNIEINSSRYGWMLRAKDHTGAGGIHPEGWSKRWTEWIEGHEAAGKRITKAMIDEQLTKMKEAFKLCDRGFPAKFSYSEAEKAYKAAERMARQKAADAMGSAAGKLGKGKVRGGGGRVRGAGGPIIGAIVGFGIALGGGYALGSADPWSDAFDSLDPFSPSMMGDGEITQALRDQWAYDAYQQYQSELSRLDAQRKVNLPAQQCLCNDQCHASDGESAPASPR